MRTAPTTVVADDVTTELLFILLALAVMALGMAMLIGNVAVARVFAILGTIVAGAVALVLILL